MIRRVAWMIGEVDRIGINTEVCYYVILILGFHKHICLQTKKERIL